jgi:hypothetical protein
VIRDELGDAVVEDLVDTGDQPAVTVDDGHIVIAEFYFKRECGPECDVGHQRPPGKNTWNDLRPVKGIVA